MRRERKPASKPVGGRPRRTSQSPASGVMCEVDPALVDPLCVLARIAADEDAPAHARVSACKALLAAGAGEKGKRGGVDITDALGQRALEIMAGKVTPN